MSGHAYLQALDVLCAGQSYQPPARSLERKPKPKLRDTRKKWQPAEDVLTPKRVSDAARRYRTGDDAAKALGISPNSFYRKCREYGIETPQARRRREYLEQREL